jgi:hypothetical protein
MKNNIGKVQAYSVEYTDISKVLFTQVIIAPLAILALMRTEVVVTQKNVF